LLCQQAKLVFDFAFLGVVAFRVAVRRGQPPHAVGKV
jgi:hypothetical protein